MHKFRAALVALLPDLLVLGGVVAVTVGADLLHPAAGWITGGTLAIAFGFLGAKR